MQDKSKFPKTMAALASVEGTVWGVVDALVAEVEITAKGIAKVGQYEAISKEAAERGFVNPSSGQPYTPNYLRQLRQVGSFIAPFARREEARRYPVNRAMKAMDKAKGDPARMMEILATGKTMHEIQQRPASPVRTEEQVQIMVKSATPALRTAMVKAALVDPDVAREVATDETVQETLTHARLDDSYRRATGKSIRPLSSPRARTEAEIEEDEAPLRPGLAYLAIGTPMHAARRSIIDAIGHAQGSDITDGLRNLILAEVEALRELLVDLQLVVEGEKQLTDADLADFLKAADDDNAAWKE